MAPSRHDWKIVDWDVKPQHNKWKAKGTAVSQHVPAETYMYQNYLKAQRDWSSELFTFQFPLTVG